MKWMKDFIGAVNKYTNPKQNNQMFGAIGSVASSLIGGLFGNHAQSEANKANAEENEKNRQFNAQQADLSYQRQRTLISEQREYDSAVNQRKRLEEAGFNPYNMMDGSNVGTTQNMSAPSAASAPSPIPMQAQRYEWLQNMAMQAAQIRNIDSQTAKNQSDAARSSGELENVQARTAGQIIQNEANSKYLGSLMKSGINLNDAQSSLSDFQRINDGIRVTLEQQRFNTMMPLEASKLAASTIVDQMNAANIDINTKQGKLTLEYLAATYLSQIAVNWATRENLLSSAGFYRANSSYLGSLQKTEDLLRGSKLRNLTLQNGNLITLGGIYGEQLKQSRWNTWQMGKIMEEATENMIIDMRSQFGSWKGYDGYDYWSSRRYAINYLFRSMLVPALGGAAGGFSQGYGFSLGSSLGQQAALPKMGKIGFLK